MQSGAFWDTILSYSVLRQGILTSCTLTSLRLGDFSNIITYMLSLAVLRAVPLFLVLFPTIFPPFFVRCLMRRWLFFVPFPTIFPPFFARCSRRRRPILRAFPNYFPAFFRSLFSAPLPCSSRLSPLSERLEQVSLQSRIWKWWHGVIETSFNIAVADFYSLLSVYSE